VDHLTVCGILDAPVDGPALPLKGATTMLEATHPCLCSGGAARR